VENSCPVSIVALLWEERAGHRKLPGKGPCTMKQMPAKHKADNASGNAASFEKGMENLEQMVKELERGELPLEESIALYERAVTLSESCRKLLQDAETRVETLRSAAAAKASVSDEDSAADEEFAEENSDEDIPF
jgi:exodeoxyribonuclease VII small subunit